MGQPRNRYLHTQENCSRSRGGFDTPQEPPPVRGYTHPEQKQVALSIWETQPQELKTPAHFAGPIQEPPKQPDQHQPDQPGRQESTTEERLLCTERGRLILRGRKNPLWLPNAYSEQEVANEQTAAAATLTAEVTEGAIQER